MSVPQLAALLEVAVYVNDLERSAAFYRTLFGLEMIFSDERLYAFGIADRQVLLLCKRTASGTLSRAAHDASGQQHVAFAIQTSDLEAWQIRLEQQAITIEETKHWPRGGVSIYFRDPDAHLLELATPGVWSIY